MKLWANIKSRILCLTFTLDGRSLLAASQGCQTIGIRSFNWNLGKVRCVVFAPDGMTCAAGGSSGQVVVWDVDD